VTCKADMMEFVNNLKIQSEIMSGSCKSQLEAVFGLFTNNAKVLSAACK
jgi:hypothetical protein